MNLKKDSWVVDNKGNILLLGILILNILIVISNTISAKLNEILFYKNVDVQMEVLKIKAIQKIENEFKEDTCKDFTLEENGKTIEVSFHGDQCDVILKGNDIYKMIIVYDYVYNCILDVEYIYDE